MSSRKDHFGKGEAAKRYPLGVKEPCGGNIKNFRDVYPQLYSQPEAKQAYDVIRRTVFEPEEWKSNYHQFLRTRKFNLNKTLRRLVQVGTIEVCLRGKYFLSEEKSVSIDRKLLENSARNTVFHEDSFEYSFKEPKQRKRSSLTSSSLPSSLSSENTNSSSEKTEEKAESTEKIEEKAEKEEEAKEAKEEEKKETRVEVIGGDCLSIAERLWKETGIRPVVLNMASSTYPGGGYESGAGAQEENLFRRSNLFQCLQDPHGIDRERTWTYPLPQYGGLYTPEAVVFRKEEAEGYAFMEQPLTFNFVSVAALRKPSLSFENGEGNEPVMNAAGEKATRRKIRTILNICAHHGQKVLVLSAFGCGAYGCPPKHVARLFCEEIKAWKENMDHLYRFEAIVFAIFDDKNAHQEHNPQGNLLPFQTEVAKRFPKRP